MCAINACSDRNIFYRFRSLCGNAYSLRTHTHVYDDAGCPQSAVFFIQCAICALVRHAPTYNAIDSDASHVCDVFTKRDDLLVRMHNNRPKTLIAYTPCAHTNNNTRYPYPKLYEYNKTHPVYITTANMCRLYDLRAQPRVPSSNARLEMKQLKSA